MAFDRPDNCDGCGRVLVLSGRSSSGKTATARAFQQREDTPWLILDADVVLAAFPFGMVPNLEAVAGRLNRGLFASVASFARQGVDVICEQVFWSQINYEDAVAGLTGLPTRFVEITSSLEAAEAREAQRSGRAIGASREQHHRLYAGVRYDHTVDTTAMTPDDAAAALAGWVHEVFPPVAETQRVAS